MSLAPNMIAPMRGLAAAMASTWFSASIRSITAPIWVSPGDADIRLEARDGAVEFQNVLGRLDLGAIDEVRPPDEHPGQLVRRAGRVDVAETDPGFLARPVHFRQCAARGFDRRGRLSCGKPDSSSCG